MQVDWVKSDQYSLIECSRYIEIHHVNKTTQYTLIRHSE